MFNVTSAFFEKIDTSIHNVIKEILIVRINSLELQRGGLPVVSFLFDVSLAPPLEGGIHEQILQSIQYYISLEMFTYPWLIQTNLGHGC